MKIDNETYNRLINNSINVKHNKYHNKKVLYDNIKFDSKKESKRYYELKLLEKAKLITELETQKKFELQESFYDNNGKKQRAITYTVDFFYHDELKKVYIAEDVKGYATDVYKIKKKLFMYQYPNIVFKEIK